MGDLEILQQMERETTAKQDLRMMRDMMNMVWEKHGYDDRWKRISRRELEEELFEEVREYERTGYTHELVSIALTALMNVLRNIRGDI